MPFGINLMRSQVLYWAAQVLRGIKVVLARPTHLLIHHLLVSTDNLARVWSALEPETASVLVCLSHLLCITYHVQQIWELTWHDASHQVCGTDSRQLTYLSTGMCWHVWC
jgi:hypothetical protein